MSANQMEMKLTPEVVNRYGTVNGCDVHNRVSCERCTSLTPKQTAYNLRTRKLVPTGDAQRDRLVRAKLAVRSDR